MGSTSAPKAVPTASVTVPCIAGLCATGRPSVRSFSRRWAVGRKRVALGRERQPPRGALEQHRADLRLKLLQRRVSAGWLMCSSSLAREML